MKQISPVFYNTWCALGLALLQNAKILIYWISLCPHIKASLKICGRAKLGIDVTYCLRRAGRFYLWRLLIVDGYASHTLMEFTNYCDQHNVFLR